MTRSSASPMGVAMLVKSYWISYDHRCSMQHCTNPASLLIDGPAQRRHLCDDHAIRYEGAVLNAVDFRAGATRST